MFVRLFSHQFSKGNIFFCKFPCVQSSSSRKGSTSKVKNLLCKFLLFFKRWPWMGGINENAHLCSLNVYQCPWNLYKVQMLPGFDYTFCVMANFAFKPRGYKTFFMLNWVEHEILNAHKYKKYQEVRPFLGADNPRMLFFPLIQVKMPTIVGILTYMSGKIFKLNWVEHKKSFYSLGPRLIQWFYNVFFLFVFLHKKYANRCDSDQAVS